MLHVLLLAPLGALHLCNLHLQQHLWCATIQLDLFFVLPPQPRLALWLQTLFAHAMLSMRLFLVFLLLSYLLTLWL